MIMDSRTNTHVDSLRVRVVVKRLFRVVLRIIPLKLCLAQLRKSIKLTDTENTLKKKN